MLLNGAKDKIYLNIHYFETKEFKEELTNYTNNINRNSIHNEETEYKFKCILANSIVFRKDTLTELVEFCAKNFKEVIPEFDDSSYLYYIPMVAVRKNIGVLHSSSIIVNEDKNCDSLWVWKISNPKMIFSCFEKDFEMREKLNSNFAFQINSLSKLIKKIKKMIYPQQIHSTVLQKEQYERACKKAEKFDIKLKEKEEKLIKESTIALEKEKKYKEREDLKRIIKEQKELEKKARQEKISVRQKERELKALIQREAKKNKEEIQKKLILEKEEKMKREAERKNLITENKVKEKLEREEKEKKMKEEKEAKKLERDLKLKEKKDAFILERIQNKKLKEEMKINRLNLQRKKNEEKNSEHKMNLALIKKGIYFESNQSKITIFIQKMEQKKQIQNETNQREDNILTSPIIKIKDFVFDKDIFDNELFKVSTKEPSENKNGENQLLFHLPDLSRAINLTRSRKYIQIEKSYCSFIGKFKEVNNEINPLNPLLKSSKINYSIDSEEEYEDKNGENIEESVISNNGEDNEIEESDSFVVPDNYLSESELELHSNFEDDNQNVISPQISFCFPKPMSEKASLITERNLLDISSIDLFRCLNLNLNLDFPLDPNYKIIKSNEKNNVSAQRKSRPIIDQSLEELALLIHGSYISRKKLTETFLSNHSEFTKRAIKLKIKEISDKRKDEVTLHVRIFLKTEYINENNKSKMERAFEENGLRSIINFKSIKRLELKEKKPKKSKSSKKAQHSNLKIKHSIKKSKKKENSMKKLAKQGILLIKPSKHSNKKKRYLEKKSNMSHSKHNSKGKSKNKILNKVIYGPTSIYNIKKKGLNLIVECKENFQPFRIIDESEGIENKLII